MKNLVSLFLVLVVGCVPMSKPAPTVEGAQASGTGLPAPTNNSSNPNPVNNNLPPNQVPIPTEVSLQNLQVNVGVKNYEQIYLTMATLSGFDQANTNMTAILTSLAPSLPTTNDPKIYSVTHTLAVVRMAAAICNLAVDNVNSRTAIWPTLNINLTPTQAFTGAQKLAFVQAMINRFHTGTLTDTQELEMQEEYLELLDNLIVGEPNTSTSTKFIMKGLCTAGLSNSRIVTF
jgi:hypothetical protein